MKMNVLRSFRINSKGNNRVGSTKGQPHKMWKQKDKLMIVKLYLEDNITPKELNKRFGVNPSLVHVWSNLYKKHGSERLKSQNGIKR